VVGYDKQEQHSLAASLRKDLFDLRRSSSAALDRARGALPSVLGPILLTVVGLSALVMIAFVARRVRHFGWRRGLKVWQTGSESSRVDFYERLVALLERQGIKRELHQTPMEFANSVGIPDAIGITEAYNRVRFGVEKLSASELVEIETSLSRFERGS
jgi:hypothetical protein